MADTVDANDLVSYATQKPFLNTKYVDHTTIQGWGPGRGWDCSSYTSYVMKKFGVNLPAYSDSQYKMGTPVEKGNLQPGDLVFFHTNDNKVTGHVGIYVGNGKMVNAANPSAGTRVQPVTWSTYVGARRVLNVTGTARNVPGSKGDVPFNGEPNPAPEGQDTLSIDDLMSMSGFTGEFLKSHPKIKEVFDRAIAEGWNDGSAVGKARFDNALRNTPWWQNNAKPARDYLVAAMQGGADFEQQRADAAAAIKADAVKIGANLDEKALAQFTTAYLMNGWKDRPDELRKALSGEGGDKFSTDHIDYGKGGPQSIITKLRQVASDNGVPLSDEYLQGAARSVIAGLRPIEDFDAEIRGHAASRFPMFGDRVRAGETVKAIASPYIQIMGQTLEKDPASITLDDPILKQAFGKVNDKGVPVAMGLWDFEKLLRARPEFRSTKTARDAVDNKIAMIGRAMGFGG